MQATKLLSAASGRQQYLALGHETSPYLSVYPWDSITGFGTKFSNPTTLPGAKITGVSFSPSGYQIVAVEDRSTNNVSAYAWTNAGFGTRYSAPSTPPGGSTTAVAFCLQTGSVAITHIASPAISAYAWSSAGFGSKYSNPSSGYNTATPYALAFSPSGDALIISGFATSNDSLQAYAWSSAGFGTKYSTSGSSGSKNGVKFSQSGNFIFVASDSGTYAFAIAWNSSTGFGTSYAPSTALQGAASGVTSYVDGGGSEFAVFSTAVSLYHGLYNWNESTLSWGSRITSALVAMNSSANCTAVNKTANSIAFGYSASPYVSVVKIGPSGIESKYSSPATAPTGTVFSASFGEIG